MNLLGRQGRQRFDGRVPGWLMSCLIAGLASAGERPRTLLISLDAVPFRVAQEVTDPGLGEAALFQGFTGPVPLVSTFPSSTSVAMVGILGPLGLDRSPGYEAQFFDWGQRKVRGGGAVSYFKIPFPWRDFFDWTRKSPTGSAVEALRPVKAGSQRLRKAVRDFVESDVETLLVYIAATDTAVHVLGPSSIVELFRSLDEILTEARLAHSDNPFEVIIFSDHGVAGGEPLKNLTPTVKRVLRESGFKVTKRLDGTGNQVVLTPFGLVSNFEAYTSEKNKSEIARLLGTIDGVDACVFEESDAWLVVGAAGEARIESLDRDGELYWRYDAIAGDPLDYASFFERNEGETGDWLADNELFAASADHVLPDALYRISHAFDLVTNPASVVCSAALGYMYGARGTERLAKIGKGPLRWTHGSLRREASLGFLMADVEGWEPAVSVRFDRALLPFAEALARHPHVTPPASE